MSRFWLAFLLGTLVSSNAFAGCDSCLQKDIKTASASINSSLSSLKTTVNTNVSATETLNNTISASSSSLVGLLESQNTQMVTAIDAATNKIILSNDKLNKTIINLTDFMTNEISQAMKSEFKIDAYLRSKETLGPQSQPISGDIAVNRAPLLQQAIVDFETKLADQLVQFKQWALLKGHKDNGQKLRRREVDKKIKELTPELDKLTQNLLTEQEVDDLLTLIKLMVLPSPKPSDTLEGKDAAEYYRQIQKKTLAFSVLARDVLLRAPLIETKDWKIGYTKVNDIDGKTSLTEFMLSETQRKYFSPEWHLDIKTKTDTGLLREQVYQTNMTNYLLNELIEEERQTLGLLSFQ
ncbi:hypothetical protein [Salinimonas chungwhensis]|uniref:hypothetical protein n=1 Tax=Salinimonas chungwhensis TaxID=265425 RepID=UPI000374BC0E|nr:hypothetical protein [Salinimonas chungwhensis]